MSIRILMIEDDAKLAAMVAEYLAQFAFNATVCVDGESGRRAFEEQSFDAVILDVMLPDTDGFELCRQLRARSDVPILMLTARGDELDRIIGLELGADDYLPKPFNPRELLARLRAIVRRQHAPVLNPQSMLRFGNLVIDVDRRRVQVAAREADITGHQFNILLLLARNAGRVMTRDAIMNELSGDALEAFDRSIDVHISRIRAAIEDDPRHPTRILTVRGVGYMLARRQDEGD